MKKVWVVVANSSLSKIYRAENTHHLIEHAIFFHEESHLHANELVSDNQGRETNPGLFGSHTNEAKTSIKMKEALLFAQQLAHFLEGGYNLRQYETLYVVAKPPFLGYLRQSLHPNVTKSIKLEVNKDLTQSSPQELREYLPPVL